MPTREQRQTMMFSATFPRTVMRIADNFLNNPAMLKVPYSGACHPHIRSLSPYRKPVTVCELPHQPSCAQGGRRRHPLTQTQTQTRTRTRTQTQTQTQTQTLNPNPKP